MSKKRLPGRLQTLSLHPGLRPSLVFRRIYIGTAMRNFKILKPCRSVPYLYDQMLKRGLGNIIFLYRFNLQGYHHA